MHMHKATDRLCPFYMERNNKNNITSLLATIHTRRLEGFENPFGLTKVRRSLSLSSNSYDSSASFQKHTAKTGNYPTQFIAEATVVTSASSAGSFQLASSSDSLFRHVPDISASQAATATTSYSQEHDHST